MKLSISNNSYGASGKGVIYLPSLWFTQFLASLAWRGRSFYDTTYLLRYNSGYVYCLWGCRDQPHFFISI